MARKSCGKRPCCICRRWFQPDVRQKGRQKTCSPACRKELHRRQCGQLYKKNKTYFKNNYLGKQIEKADSTLKVPASKSKKKPDLPLEVVTSEYGEKSSIVVRYLVTQVINYNREMTSGFT